MFKPAAFKKGAKLNFGLAGGDDNLGFGLEGALGGNLDGDAFTLKALMRDLVAIEVQDVHKTALRAEHQGSQFRLGVLSKRSHAGDHIADHGTVRQLLIQILLMLATQVQ